MNSLREFRDLFNFGQYRFYRAQESKENKERNEVPSEKIETRNPETNQGDNKFFGSK